MDENREMEIITEEQPAPENTEKAKKSYTRVAFALFAMAAITIALQVLLGYFYGRMLANGFEAGSWLLWLINFLPLYAIALPVTLWILCKLPRGEGEPERLGVGKFLLILVMCFPVMYIGNLIGTALSGLLSGGSAVNGLEELAMDDSWLRIPVMVVFAPLVEEYVFRKQLIDRTARFGEKQAILFSGLTFGLFHMNLFQFFYAFGLGLIFAYVYTRTRRLRYTVALHMIINFLGSVVAPALAQKSGFLENGGEIAADMSGDQLLFTMLLALYGLLMIGLSIAGIVLLIIHAKKLRFVPAAEEMPKEKSFSTVYVNLGMLLFVLLCLAVFVLQLVDVSALLS